MPRASHMLRLPGDFPYPGLHREIAPGDTMFEGDDTRYLTVGRSALACIESALAGTTPANILDLPCGYGRVTRFLRARFPRARITACDLDRPGVEFCASRFKARPAYSVEDFQQLDVRERYDLIWVGSLITHLGEAATRAFLAAMARHMTPGALLIATSHGPSIGPLLSQDGYGLGPRESAAVLDAYAGTGYGHRGYGGGGEGYGIAMTDEGWWTGVLAAMPLSLKTYQDRAWDGHQDVVVMSRSAQPPRPPRHGDGHIAALERRVAAHYDPMLRHFGAAFYLGTYPDVAAAIGAGHFRSAYDHYRRTGRAEGRLPYPRPPVPDKGRFDEAAYLAGNPDVARAVARGAIASGYAHWVQWGFIEGRTPAAAAPAPTSPWHPGSSVPARTAAAR